ncbi:MAG: DNA mismatch repair endonuclease MutL [Bacteroidales bacterium]|nr:DNA mismatch repair endonuclease MutL [Bacteroidales bacterium]
MLKVLPQNIASLIAAGEVIQRPASVVKELMENSVDAGAKNVTLALEDSGRTLIQVIDNGCGMSPEEAELCFERHATSKISEAEDLFYISSYGFRGEALPSIASCCEVTLRTRRKEDELGYQVQISANKISSTSQVSTPVGTNIAARNIFWNIPARRKFLKSDATEYKQIISEFNRIALTRPDMSFKLIHNGQQVLEYPAVANVKLRIAQAGGKDIAKDLLPIEVDTTIVKISGFIGTPGLARKSQQNQYFFVNGRYFKSPLLFKALANAYKGLLPEGHIPSYFVYFSINPEQMDINIHPTKTEIKFEDESILFEVLHSAAKQTLGMNSMMPSIDFDTEGAIDIPAFKGDFSTVHQPRINYNPLFNPFEKDGKGHVSFSSLDKGPGLSAAACDSLLEDAPAGTESNFVVSCESTSLRKVMGNRYLVDMNGERIKILDCLAAAQRIVYERYLSRCNSSITCQELLFPQTVAISATSAAVLEENRGLLERSGYEFSISRTGASHGNERSLCFSGVPAIGNIDLSKADSARALADEILGILGTPGGNVAKVLYDRMARVAARMAAAVPAGVSLSVEKALSIESELLKCKCCSNSPFGGVCMKIVSPDDIINVK